MDSSGKKQPNQSKFVEVMASEVEVPPISKSGESPFSLLKGKRRRQKARTVARSAVMFPYR